MSGVQLEHCEGRIVNGAFLLTRPFKSRFHFGVCRPDWRNLCAGGLRFQPINDGLGGGTSQFRCVRDYPKSAAPARRARSCRAHMKRSLNWGLLKMMLPTASKLHWQLGGEWRKPTATATTDYRPALPGRPKLSSHKSLVRLLHCPSRFPTVYLCLWLAAARRETGGGVHSFSSLARPLLWCQDLQRPDAKSGESWLSSPLSLGQARWLSATTSVEIHLLAILTEEHQFCR